MQKYNGILVVQWHVKRNIKDLCRSSENNLLFFSAPAFPKMSLMFFIMSVLPR
jgi:hypothetical protein